MVGLVFPEQMNKVDVQDTEAALSTIVNYINYMVERIEFTLQNINNQNSN